MNKKYLVYLLAILAIAALTYWYFSKNDTQMLSSADRVIPQTPLSASEPDSVNVIIGENGNFAPSEIKIKKGGKVTWVNKSQKQVWPASNPHPIHTDYPDFDALRGLANGESYSFTFEKVGSWGYHNHINPGAKGAVQVVE